MVDHVEVLRSGLFRVAQPVPFLEKISDYWYFFFVVLLWALKVGRWCSGVYIFTSGERSARRFFIAFGRQALGVPHQATAPGISVRLSGSRSVKRLAAIPISWPVLQYPSISLPQPTLYRYLGKWKSNRGMAPEDSYRSKTMPAYFTGIWLLASVYLKWSNEKFKKKPG